MDVEGLPVEVEPVVVADAADTQDTAEIVPQDVDGVAPDALVEDNQGAVPPMEVTPVLEGEGALVEPSAEDHVATEAVVVAGETGVGGAVTTFNNHEFTTADVQDVVKLQSLYRMKQAQNIADDRRHQKQAEQTVDVAIEPITLPVSEPTPNSLTADETAAEKKSVLSKVDFTNIKINNMSADTKGMQKMYNRMLRSKMWW